MKNKFIKFSIILVTTFVMVTSLAYAQGATGNKPAGGTGNAPTTITLDNPFGKVGSSLLDLVSAIVDNIVLPIGGVLAVLAFIWGGFQYVMAQGSPEKLKKANRTLLHAVIGTVLILGAYAITSVIGGTLEQLR